MNEIMITENDGFRGEHLDFEKVQFVMSNVAAKSWKDCKCTGWKLTRIFAPITIVRFIALVKEFIPILLAFEGQS